MVRNRTRTAVLVAFVISTAGACGRTSTVVASRPEPVPATRLADLTVVPNAVDLTPIRFESAQPGPTDTTVELRVLTGTAPCNVVGRVDVAETSTSVTITVLAGRDEAGLAALTGRFAAELEEDPETAIGCDSAARLYRHVVVLESPLAGREVIDGAVAGDADVIDPGDGLRPTRVEVTPGARNLRARPFESAVAHGERQIAVRFYGGVPPCSVVGKVDVKETSQGVTITLFDGTAVGGEDVACIEIARYLEVLVTLSEPLGKRLIVDGAS